MKKERCPLARARPSALSFVYFAKFADATIKIGISRNLNDRLNTLRRETRLKASFIGRLELTTRDARIVERALHRELGPYWIRGEWYADVPAVRAAIAHLLREPSDVQAIVDRVRLAEREAKVAAAKPQPRVQVIARLARDVVRTAPERPDQELADEVAQLCTKHRIPYDDDSVTKALRMALARVRVETPTKLIVRVLQDVVAHQRFATYGDLVETLKCRCARLRVPYDSGLIAAAVDRLERGGKTPIIPAPVASRVVEPIPDEPLISRGSATAILRQLGLTV